MHSFSLNSSIVLVFILVSSSSSSAPPLPPSSVQFIIRVSVLKPFLHEVIETSLLKV